MLSLIKYYILREQDQNEVKKYLTKKNHIFSFNVFFLKIFSANVFNKCIYKIVIEKIELLFFRSSGIELQYVSNIEKLGKNFQNFLEGDMI